MVGKILCLSYLELVRNMVDFSRWWANYSYGEILNFLAIGPDDLYTKEEIKSMLENYILNISKTNTTN